MLSRTESIAEVGTKKCYVIQANGIFAMEENLQAISSFYS